MNVMSNYLKGKVPGLVPYQEYHSNTKRAKKELDRLKAIQKQIEKRSVSDPALLETVERIGQSIEARSEKIAGYGKKAVIQTTAQVLQPVAAAYLPGSNYALDFGANILGNVLAGDKPLEGVIQNTVEGAFYDTVEDMMGCSIQ